MKKLLILDDNVELLEIMNRILAPQFDVTICVDIESALYRINKLLPDLIILDYFVGSSNTEDIVKQLRCSSFHSVPIILFSASPDIEEVAGRLGIAGYLEKPSSISKIRSYIKDIFEQTAANRQNLP